MSSFRTYTIYGIRYGTGVFDKGTISAGTENSFQFIASVQSLNGRELLTLPEGQRQVETYKVFTDYELKTVDEKNKTKADRITLFGKKFDIIKVEIWQNKVVPHYKAIASLVNA